jgi:DNA-binding transcriptional LysR family regulator
MLGLTRSAISRRLDRLEARLGVRLLNRTTRRISLTDAGEALYRRGTAILADIAEAEFAASRYGAEPQGTLKVQSAVMIGMHKIVPLLPDFLERYSLIKVQLDLSDEVSDPHMDDHDVSIRWGALADSPLVAVRISCTRQIICAAPDYLRRFGTPKHPRGLANHNCLLLSGLGIASNEWAFDIDGRRTDVRVAGNFVVNSGNGNYEALVAGLGIGRVTDLRVQADIRAGRLQPVLEEFEPKEATPIHALYKGGRHVPPKVRAFVSFLREKLRGAAD